ncbi:MAG: stage III sporulation protein AF [Lachnospiraceae bacterium]|nr:stage III sporulation protein AF [Lachnospiraceae bacterium]
MFDNVLEIIRKAGIFMILAQTILHLCVNESYEKYIKMLVGLITAILLIFPIFELIKEDGFQDFEQYRSEYEAELLGGAPDFETIKENAWNDWMEENTGM